MANVFKPKRSNTAAKVPTTTDLVSGEMGVNMADKKVYINNGTSVVQVGAGALTGLSDVTVSSPSNGQVLSYNGSAWVNSSSSGGTSVTVSTAAPSSPSAGALWWDSTLGTLRIYYNDGNTSQWVDAAIGSPGADAAVALGTVTTVNPTVSPSITSSGTAGAGVFNFSLPRAAAVSLGSTTTLNPNGTPAVADSGTSGDVVLGFSIPRAAAVSVGTVSTGAAGSSATVSNVGANGDVVLNFAIPKGDTGSTGATGPMGPKAALLGYPTTADTKVVLFYTTSALTVSKIVSVLPSGSATPSVSFNVRYGSDVSAAGTAVTSAAITTTNVSTGTSTTSFSSASITAGSFVWVEVTAVSGTVPALSVTVEF